METLFVISTDWGGRIFSITYLLAFLICITIFLYAGFRKKYSAIPLLLITLSGVIFFVIGNKLFTNTPAEWISLFADSQLPIRSGKTILGGIIGLIFGLYLAKQWLKFKHPLIDHLSIALPVCMAIQRIGCLFSGCCFGKPTNDVWGIQYTVESLAYQRHLDQGLVHFHEMSSLPVHPTQVYQIIGCLLIAFMVWKVKKHLKIPGNLFLFSIASYGILRFITEFFRDPFANGLAGELFLGIKYVQWIVLIAIVLIFIIIWRREQKKTEAKPEGGLGINFNYKHLLFFIVLIGIIRLCMDWFDFREQLIVYFMLPTIIILMLRKVFRLITAPGFRWSTLGILFAGIIIMGQTYFPKDPNERVTYLEISGGAIIGKFYNEINKVTQKSYSGGNTCYELGESHYRQHSFYNIGTGITRHIRKEGFQRGHIGAKLHFGMEKEIGLDDDFSENYFLFGFTPYGGYDWQWFGWEIGLQIGNLRYGQFTDKNPSVGYYMNELKTTPVFPQFSIRVFPYDKFYMKYSFTNHFPSSSLLPYHKFGIGTGLGKRNGTAIEAGVTEAGIYFHTIYPIKERYVIDLFYGGLGEWSNTKNKYALSFGFHYRFLYKRNPLK